MIEHGALSVMKYILSVLIYSAHFLYNVAGVKTFLRLEMRLNQGLGLD